MNLVEQVYQTSKNLPADERFGLVTQMCRAAVSIPFNIAEGFGRQASGEYSHHLSIARGSLLELETHILLCQRPEFLIADQASPLLNEITEPSKMPATVISKSR
jgi:four helix bundle protein